MTWHVYTIFRVVALCALLVLHSALIGIVSTWMLSYEAGALQFAMDIVALIFILGFSVLKYKRRTAESNRVLNLITFSILLVPCLAGAIGLSIRAASRDGKGLCKNPDSENPSKCREAAAALAITWISVMIALAGIVVSLLDRSSRAAISNNPYGNEIKHQHQQSKSSFQSLSSRTHIPGPTASYIPRPRDPYDTPRRKRSARQPQRVPSNRAPAPPLPPLPSFNPLELESDATATQRVDRRQGPSRTRSHREARKDLPELPPPTRRAPVDPQQREIRRVKHLSPTDLFASMG